MDKKKLAIIHIVKKELDLSDEEYRNILEQSAGVRSAKDLDEEKFRKVMKFFVRSKHYRPHRLGLTIKQKLFMKYLAEQLGWDQPHLNNFIHKYFKTDLDKLSQKDAGKVIGVLKSMVNH